MRDVKAFAETLNGQGLSNALSLLAIVIALVVAVVEQRRAGAEARRAVTAKKAQRESFVNTAQEVIGEAVRQLDRELVALGPAEQAMFVDTRPIEHVISPLYEVMKALQAVAPFDGHLAVTLSRATRSLHDLSVSEGLPTAPAALRYATYTAEARSDLLRRSEQLGRLRKEGARLTESEVAVSIAGPAPA